MFTVWVRRLRRSPVQRTLTLAMIEGAVVGGMFAASESFFVPMLQIRLRAGPGAIGALTSVPMQAAAVIGLFVGWIIARLGGNRRAVLVNAAAQIMALAAMSVPIHLSDRPWAMPTALVAAIVFGSVGAFAGPAWTSWMGELIPRGIRGRYHSARFRLFTGTKLLFAALYACLVKLLPLSETATGIQIILATAIACRLVSLLLVRAQHEPEPHAQPQGVVALSDSLPAAEGRGFLTFLRTLPATPLGRWTAVFAALHFGVSLAGPYFQVYMLDGSGAGLGLGDHPEVYIPLLQTSMLVRVFAFPAVGHLVDLFGAAAMLRISIGGIAVVPLIWASTPNLRALFAIEVLSGLSWCTAECAVGVLLFSCHRSPAERARLIGYHQALVATVIAVGSAIGGRLLTVLPPLDGSGFRRLFLLSAAMRMPALLIAFRFLPELPDERGELTGLWRLIPGVRPTITLSRGLMHFFRRPEG